MSFDTDKFMEDLQNPEKTETMLTDIANFFEKLIEYIGKLFKAFTIKANYIDDQDPWGVNE